mmetsp:Transcript_25977/g.53364  ORF Transcript_25977/g.53364 Transcript_25977/m.53364 type:complete len:87 (-) Transcript_25977:1939-2199(-)
MALLRSATNPVTMFGWRENDGRPRFSTRSDRNNTNRDRIVRQRCWHAAFSSNNNNTSSTFDNYFYCSSVIFVSVLSSSFSVQTVNQ